MWLIMNYMYRHAVCIIPYAAAANITYVLLPRKIALMLLQYLVAVG